jgi:hypothetical protein
MKVTGKVRAAASTCPSDGLRSTAEELLAKKNLTVKNVEPKGSCWLFAVLANVGGAVDNPNNPTVRDRLLDWHIRGAIHAACMSYSRLNFNAIGVTESNDLAGTLAHIHELPTQGKRRGDGGLHGWVPSNGWAGSTAFRFLAP